MLATKPNELWSWDITKLKGAAKWTYFYLYVVLDVFSRYVVGWMIAPRESAMLAKRLIAETCRREDIAPSQRTLHAERGSAMTSHSFALLLADLGVTKTHFRPHVSNDNQHARAHCGRFFDGYNSEHRHGALGLCTPDEVHHGLAADTVMRRAAILDAASLANQSASRAVDLRRRRSPPLSRSTRPKARSRPRKLLSEFLNPLSQHR